MSVTRLPSASLRVAAVACEAQHVPTSGVSIPTTRTCSLLPFASRTTMVSPSMTRVTSARDVKSPACAAAAASSAQSTTAAHLTKEDMAETIADRAQRWKGRFAKTRSRARQMSCASPSNGRSSRVLCSIRTK